MEEKKEKKVDLDIKIEEKKEWSKPRLLSGKEISFGGFFRFHVTGPTSSPTGS